MTVKIGFEIHVQLNTKQKLFCECPTDYRDKEPNTNICPICTAQPGSKPMAPNKEAIKNVIKIGLFLGCKPVKNKAYILRKHYFYPDLPSNYQRTSEPLMVDGNFFGVRIREIHLEEDPGRYELRNGYVDYNRSGIPLAEIVTEPDLTSPDHARDWLKQLFLYLSYLKAIRPDPGSIRVDVNVSLEGGERVEIKNVNSIDNVYYALMYEIARHKRALESGEIIKRETRHFDEDKKITVPLREKETVADYRYIPDPDLLPIQITDEFVEEVKAELPPSPLELAEELKEKYKIKEHYIQVLISDPDLVLFARDVFSISNLDSNYVAEWITNKLKRALYNLNLEMYQVEIDSKLFLKLVENVKQNKIAERYVIRILEEFITTGKDPVKIAEEKGWITISDEGFIEKLVEEVLNEEKQALEDLKSGEKKAFNYLVGCVVKKSQKKADAKKVIEILRKKLSELEIPL